MRLVRLASGRIVLGGTHLDYSVHFLCCPSSIGLAAIMPDGAVDRAFGDGGFAEARFPEQADPGVIVGADAFRAEQDAGGGTTLVLAGLLSGPERSGRVFARFTETGELVEEHFTPRP